MEIAVQPVRSDAPTGPDLERWVEDHADRLYRSACYLASPSEAEDLCQEVFCVAARRLGDFEGRSRPYTWLYGILRNLVRERRRKMSRPAPPAPTGTPPPPERVAGRREVGQRVRQAVDRLPEGQREVVVLFYLEEQGVSQVAEALELPPGTVKSRLFAARRKLEQALASMEEWTHEL